ncbi:MAG: hypothetical protein P4L56_26095 [Candidatus Sulfopaludibacter sp.]|nr:hypothetical protein [Candidatus Sulfopaludibacter sp.]
MRPAALGHWGIQLSAGDFACALAALGVLQQEEWTEASDPSAEEVAGRLWDIRVRTEGALAWQWSPGRGRSLLRPDVLKDAWKIFHERRGPAIDLELRIEWEPWDPLWTVSELSRPEVGARSVYVAQPERRSPNARWHWPLRLGVLGDAAPLQSEMKAQAWPEAILSVVDLAATGGRCDLLLVPGTVRTALARVLSFEGAIESPCVVVAGPIAPSSGTVRLAGTLINQTRANALALVNPTGRPLEGWFLDFVARISHNERFDVALADSLVTDEGRRFYLLRANREWIESVRLSAIAGTLRERLASPELAHEMQHPIQLLQQFSNWGRESGDATTLALLTNAVAPKLRETRRQTERRFLQAWVLDARDGASDTPLAAFRAGALHRIDVRIGPAGPEWLSSARFRQEELPPSAKGHWLTVVATNPFTAPQVSRMFLPPEGPSTICSCYLAVGEHQERGQLRVSVLYKNRVLQTAMLDGPVAEGGSEGISFDPEVVVDASMADLDNQASFGAAMVLNHTAAGDPQVLKIVDDHAELINTGPLTPYVDLIEDELRRCPWGSRNFRALTAPGTESLLRFLAVHGSLLYRGVVKGQFADAAMAAAQRIQLIAARPGVRLPVEYFYDRPSPDEDAVLCPSAVEALSRGKCSDRCSARRNSSRYVCPLGFWGLTRVLEWHTFRRDAARQLGNSDFALQDDKNACRKQLRVLERAIVAASDRADAEVKNSVPRLIAAIQKLEVPCTVSATWPEWKKNIATLGPTLLVLIPHTDMHQTLRVPTMEIGTAQWLTLDQIDDSYVHTRKVHPVVLLLGCETSQNNVPFEDFVSTFAQNGASIVVASRTLILGRQATVLAAQFVAVLKKMSAQKGATFGDVMLAVRRAMLRKGYPMVLSVSAVGDADWRL